MPLLRTETIHDWMCKIYDKDRVMVGTTARRFTMNVPADETSWVATRLRAELIKRELANAPSSADSTSDARIPHRTGRCSCW